MFTGCLLIPRLRALGRDYLTCNKDNKMYVQLYFNFTKVIMDVIPDPVPGPGADTAPSSSSRGLMIHEHPVPTSTSRLRMSELSLHCQIFV